MEELKFERLSDVELIETPSTESHVLIVENGEVKQAPKAAICDAEEEFAKLSSVEVIEEPTDESHVLIVENGELRQAPKTAVGGAGGYIMMLTESEVTLSDATFTVTANADEMLKVFEKGGSVWMRVPSVVIDESMATTIPYCYVLLNSFFIATNSDTNALNAFSSGHLAIEPSTGFVIVFTNVTYEPFK